MDSPSMNCRSRNHDVGSDGNSRNMARRDSRRPVAMDAMAWLYKYGMSLHLRCVNFQRTAVADSSLSAPLLSSGSIAQGTRYDPDPWRRECEQSRPKATQRLSMPGPGEPSKP